MLHTADGLLRGEVLRRQRGEEDYVSSVHQAYLRWLLSQREASSHRLFPLATGREQLGWLYRLRAMRSRRAPETTCILALRSEFMGNMEQPVNTSKGCGGIVRVAPVGLFFEDADTAFEMGCRVAALTHGHPSGYLAAGTFAAVIRLLFDGGDFRASLERVIGILRTRKGHEECLQLLERAQEPREPVVEVASACRGAGWVAGEALAIGAACALEAEGDFRGGVLRAVNQSGESDSTGAIAGSLLGAMLSCEAIPRPWIDRLELGREIDLVADDLMARYRMGMAWSNKYPAAL
jgi:ADP-ribosylglycohydrolase